MGDDMGLTLPGAVVILVGVAGIAVWLAVHLIRDRQLRKRSNN